MIRSALATFVGVYLDEDLFDAYTDEFEALSDFLIKDHELAVALPAEIDAALAGHRDEADLASLLLGLGMNIDTAGLTYREWLNRISDRARAATSVGGT